MSKPQVKPSYPYFSSGPCAKPPGWSLNNLNNGAFSRSHRSMICKQKLKEVIDKSRKLLEIPDDYIIGIVPGSDTGAVEMAMWSLLGPRCVEVYSWENFGHDWTIDILDQLPLEKYIDVTTDYGVLPDFKNSDPENDIIFTWNGTTSGVRIKDTDWISSNRKGLTICDATSAAFSMNLDWPKLDVTTYSWQKVLGSEAAHGMIILSPRAVERLENYVPNWPIPKIFRMAENKKLNKALFEGLTINTPSLLCVEDVLNSLNWASEIGGLKELIKISEKNLDIVKEWISKSSNFKFLANDHSTLSCTSICIVPKDKWFEDLSEELKSEFMNKVYASVEENGAGYDFNSYKTAPVGIRIWGGSTVENKNISDLLPWIDWSYEYNKKLWKDKN